MRIALSFMLLAACTVPESTSTTQSSITLDAGACLEEEIEQCRLARDAGYLICDQYKVRLLAELRLRGASPGGLFEQWAKIQIDACYAGFDEIYATCEQTACMTYADSQP